MGGGGRGECGSLAPPRPAQPPVAPLHLQPNGLLRAPYLIPATAAAPAPSRSPPRPRAPKRLGGALSVSVVAHPLPSPRPRGPRLASAQRGAGRDAPWGAPPPCPCCCSWPAAGRPAGPTSPRTVSLGGAALGGGGPGRGLRSQRGGGACGLCLGAGARVAAAAVPGGSARASVSVRGWGVRAVHLLYASLCACAPGSLGSAQPGLAVPLSVCVCLGVRVCVGVSVSGSVCMSVSVCVGGGVRSVAVSVRACVGGLCMCLEGLDSQCKPPNCCMQTPLPTPRPPPPAAQLRVGREGGLGEAAEGGVGKEGGGFSLEQNNNTGRGAPGWQYP